MKLTVVGTGLMGSSFAIAARRADLFRSIQGLDPDTANAQSAMKLGVIDAIVDEVPEDSDLILLACPSDMVAQWVDRLRDHTGISFDVGSIKAPILEALRTDKPGVPARFVPCHPVAGSDRSGPGAADPEMFFGRNVIVTPVEETDPRSVEVVRGLWTALGANTFRMKATAHDEKLALTSHLPHFLATAYMLGIDESDRPFTGGGFRDFSRIAGSTPSMWGRIFAMNQTALRSCITQFRSHLDALDQALDEGDQQRLLGMLENAANMRQQFRDEDTLSDDD
jgi:3-phosphoshikimate 1-carboxyvinyltransferase